MSDEENYSDVKTEDEEAQPMMVKPTGLKPAIKPAGGLWKKVGRQRLPCEHTFEPKMYTFKKKSPFLDIEVIPALLILFFGSKISTFR